MSEKKPKKKSPKKSKAPASADVSPDSTTVGVASIEATKATKGPRIRPPKDKKESYSRRWLQSVRGADTRLNEEVHEKIVALLKKGNYLETAAVSVGIDRVTLRAWIQQGVQDPTGIYGQFARDCDQAQMEWEASANEALAEAGKTDWRATYARLQSRFPERWNPQRINRLEVSGPGGAPIEVDSTRDRLAKKIAALTATTVQDAQIETDDPLALPATDDGSISRTD